MRRPKTPTASGTYVTTPAAGTMIQLLGPGLRAGPITLSRDETRALNRLYGFEPEKPNERPPKPERKPDPPDALPYQRRDADEAHKRAVTAWEKWTDPQPLMQAGADRNMVRCAEQDGLRLVAWMAKFVPRGEDPLKILVQLAGEGGWDVAPEDITWVAEDPQEE